MFSPRLKYFIEARRYKKIASSLEYNTRKTTLNKGQVQLFMKIFDMSYMKTYNLLLKHTNLHIYEKDRLQKAFAMLQQFGFTSQHIQEYPQVLTVLPASIEHHSLILEEVGFEKYTLPTIKNYLILQKKQIRLLKTHSYIPQDIDVQEKLLTYLPEVTASTLQIPGPDKEQILGDVRQTILRKYLMWRLNMNLEEIDHLYQTYPRVRNKSFRLMIKTLDLLENDLGFTKDKIKRNGYLVHGHPDNITNMLTNIKELGGLDIRTVVSKQPKLLLTNYETVAATAKHLEDFNISNAAIQKCYEVFTLGSKSVLERLLDLRSIPEFHVLSSHPRILRLVHYQKKAMSRLSYLQQLRVKCASLHILSTNREQFEKYAREGADKTKGKDIISFLSKHLDQSPSEMRLHLNRHPFWCHVPLVTVEQTLLLLLKTKHFTSRHISHNLHIVLYPKELVNEQLNNLSAFETRPKMSKCQQLALCLYFIEKEHHFTGNGIWQEQEPSDQILAPDAISPLPPDSYSQTHHYSYGLRSHQTIK